MNQSLGRLRDIFLRARELPADQRPAFLDRACGGDASLRTEVESLLAADVAATLGLLGIAAVADTALADSQSAAKPVVGGPHHPIQVGCYHILSVLGEGGMGTVYKAEQRSPIKRTVALKLIKLGFDSREVIARFESERQALARMNHPNIAKVLDVGTDEMGRPYFAMEYVPGIPITRYADENKLSIKHRLELFMQVCDAIAHAHSKAIIHRDIKASNVLAYVADGKSMTKVIDFGIAKALTDDRLTDHTFNTDRGQVIGTYGSMSPEQADGSADIDTRTDVYSLGVMLYELLCGAKPFDVDTLRRAADDEVRRIIREVEPPRPSTRLSSHKESITAATSRQTHVDALARQLRSELEWIPLKAMRKERLRRYASPLQLAEDIRNYLDGKPLIAGPETNSYRLKKFIIKRRGPLAVAAAIVILLVLGIIGTGLGFIGQRRLRIQADQAAAAAEQARLAETAAKEEAVKQRNVADVRLVDALRAEAEAQSASNQNAASHQSFADARQEAERVGISTESIELGLLECESRNPSPIASYHFGGLALALGPDDRTVASIGPDGRSLQLWNILTGVTTATLAGATKPVRMAVFSPSGRLIAAGGSAGEVIVWSRSGAMRFPPLALGDQNINALAFSPDESRLAVAGDQRQGMLVNLATGSVVSTFITHPGRGTAIAFTPDGTTIVCAGGPVHDRQHELHIWDAATGRELHDLAPPSDSYGTTCEAMSRDGRRAAASDWYGNVTVFDPKSGLQVASAKLYRGATTLAFLPDGESLFAMMPNGSVYLIDANTGNLSRRLMGLEGSVNRGGLSSSGDLIWEANYNSTAVWNLAEPPAIRPLYASSDYTHVALSPGADFFVFTDDHGGLNITDCATGKPLLAMKRNQNQGYGMAEVLPDGRHIVWPINWGSLGILDLAGDAPYSIISSRTSTWTTSIAISPDGRLAATEQYQHCILLWDVSNGQFLRSLDQPEEASQGCVEFSPDGKMLLTGSNALQQVWDVDTSRRLGQSRFRSLGIWYHGHGAVPLADDRFAVADSQGNLGVYRAADANPIWRHGSTPIRDLAVSPDSKRLFTACEDLSVRVWDASNGDLIHSFSDVGKSSAPFFAYSRTSPKLVVWDGQVFSLWDFKRMETQRQMESRAQKAKDSLRDNPDDGQSLTALGEYYAFRGAWSCAAELLESARQHGATVFPLTLARCYWQMGKPDAAVREFEAAALQKAADPLYLRLCEKAVRNPPQPAVETPTTLP